MPIDLNDISVPECKGRCNKEERRTLAPKDICQVVTSKVDNYPIRCVGSWSRDKIYYLLQYFSIFSTAMHRKWEGNINYVEICCGPGRCIARDKKVEFDGTSLAVMKKTEFKYLSNGIFIDFDNEVLEILDRRLSESDATNYSIVKGDYTKSKELVESLLSLIDIKSGLTLFFIDPTDCSVPFSLIQRIKENFKNSDFIINIAIGTDFTRNVVGSIREPDSYLRVRNKYSRFLGTADFFHDKESLELALRNSTDNLRTKFREYYVRSLNKIGLEYTDFKRIGHYYDLVFASQNGKGIEFWHKATKHEPDGQKKFDFID